MERKSLNTTNNNNIKSQMMKEYWECKSEMRCGGGDDYMNGLMWPPRSYTCSFCKREFRSAQALGGHMNVHRRDRARLRQQTPPPPTTILNLNLNPNTSAPSFSSSPSSTIMLKKPFSTIPTTLPSLVSPILASSSSPSHPPPPSNNTSSPSSYDLMKKWVVDGIMLNPSSTKASSESTKMMMKNNATSLSMGFGDHCNNDPFAQEHGGNCKAVKKADGIIRLDLHIGLLSDSKDDLDLELRLGTCS